MMKRVDACEVHALVITRRLVEATSKQDGRRQDDDDEKRPLGCDRAAQRTVAVTGGLTM
jgi:hypothetical protein